MAFEVVHSPAEEVHDAAMNPDVLCELNAALKAEAVARLRPDATVIGSDTLVFIDDIPLGKPRDLEEARGMLRRLSGRTHQVMTAVALVAAGREQGVLVVSEVTFAAIDVAVWVTTPCMLPMSLTRRDCTSPPRVRVKKSRDWRCRWANRSLRRRCMTR